MKYTRHFVCVADSIKGQANQAAVQLGIDPEGKLNTFQMPLFPTGSKDDAVATHHCAMGRMPALAKAAILKNLQSGQALPAKWWSFNDDSGEEYMTVTSSYDGSLVGQKFSNTTAAFNACLAACGLQRRVVPLIQAKK